MKPQDNRIFRVILLLLLVFQQLLISAQESSTILSGTVKNPIVEELKIKFFQDNITYEELIFDLTLDQSDHFAARLNIEDPISASLIYRNLEFPIFLFPGDSLNIFFDALNPAQNIKFSGKGAVQNQWFFESSLAFREYDEEVINEKMIKLKPFDFYQYLERVYIRKQQFMREWFLGRIVQSSVKSYITSDLDYWFVYQLFRYPSFHIAVNGIKGDLELPDAYFNSLSAIFVNNPFMLSNENYVNFLDKLRQFWNDEPGKRDRIYNAISEVYLDASNTLMLADYKNGPVIGSFESGTSFLPTGRKSEEVAELQIGSKFVSGYWSEMKNNQGVLGWVHDYGLETLPVFDRLGNSFYNLLTGNTLAFALTRAIYWEDSPNELEMISLAAKADEAGRYEKFLLVDSIATENVSKLNVLNAAETAGVFGEKAPVKPEPKVVINRVPSEVPVRPMNLPDIGIELDEVSKKIFKISGRITGANDRQIALTWITDPVQQKDEKRIIQLDGAGRFSLELELLEVVFGSFSVGRDAIDLIMRPGRNLEINLTGSDLSRTNIYGANAAAAEFLLAKDNYLKSINPVYNRMIKELDGAGFTAYLKGHKQALLRILGNTAKINFQDLTLLEADINYWLGNELMNFPWEQPLRLGRDAPMVMPNEFYQFIEEISLEDDGSLGNPNYVNYVSQVLTHWRNTQGFTALELAEQRLSGKTAWWVKASQLALPLQRGDVGAVANDIVNFIETCPHPEYKNELKLLYNANKGLGIGDPAPAFVLRDNSGQEINLESLKGKVIYLDFWATWCTPCLTQMRNSKQWKKQFDGRPVEFLYISLDRNRSDWSNFLAAQKVEGIHLHAGDNKVFMSNIAQLYKVKKLPAIFIINKEGQIEYSSGDPSILNASAEIIQSLL